MIVFLVQGADGPRRDSILVDSPARVTDGGHRHRPGLSAHWLEVPRRRDTKDATAASGGSSADGDRCAAGVPCAPGQRWGGKRTARAASGRRLPRGARAEPFDLRAACARWARFTQSAYPAPRRSRCEGHACRASFFSAAICDSDSSPSGCRATVTCAHTEQARDSSWLDLRISADADWPRLLEPASQYFEPDCDGPDFLTTSIEILRGTTSDRDCWQRAARATFPNDPCIDELWGHAKIGWDSKVAAHSLPRIVAVLDSGIDASHADLAFNVVSQMDPHEPRARRGSFLNSHCATSGRCYPHGTEMAGTIGGRMDNGIGVVGVAPNSRLLPIVISQRGPRPARRALDHCRRHRRGRPRQRRRHQYQRQVAGRQPRDFRVDPRCRGRGLAGRRLVVTGYATSLDSDDTVREYFPSQYRCLPGVMAAVPADMRGHDLFNPKTRPCDGRPNSGTWRGHRGDNHREFLEATRCPRRQARPVRRPMFPEP